ncbi:MAG TPA: hypothetical protein VGO04_13080 [Ensifer sp.]|uniref:hypothetical protein n=1 Tax=Ensifer sp. TaxID=1872086 RepID=UPI002E0E78C6|nr:hypothetical protein [Ensifer sp.]
MKPIRTATLVLSLAVLASCAPSQDDYARLQTAAQGSPALQKAMYQECVNKRWSKSDLQGGALLLSVPPSKVPTLTCKRLVNALASGRLKYADVRQNMNNGGPTVNLIKILQGR